MAKKGYIGINNVARKIKKSYIGIDNIARKIKKAYIGIGGVARPCLGAGEVEYYGQITPLSVNRDEVVAQTIGGYALFAGGYYNAYDDYQEENWAYPQASVDTYNTSLTRGSAPALNTATYGMTTTIVGDYSLFLGGYTQNGDNEHGYVYNRIETYNSSLTHGQPGGTDCYYVTCATTGNYAVFVGGTSDPQGYAYSNKVQSMSTSLTMTTSSSQLDYQLRDMAGGQVNGTAVFAGGMVYNAMTGSSYTCCFNNNLTKTVLSGTKATHSLSTLNHVIFCYNNTNDENILCAFDKSLTKINMTPFNVDKKAFATVSLGNYGLFGGGHTNINPLNGTETMISDVLIYDENLTVCPQKSLSTARCGLAATSIGNFALFGGGRTNINPYINGTALSIVEAFSI